MSERQGDGWSGDIGGNCPVQGDGLVDGKPWYFRARGVAWSFEVADDPLCPDASWVSSFGEPGVEIEDDYDVGDAGWMDEDVAWSLIEGAIARYRSLGGTERRADGIGQLFRCLKFFPEELDAWTARWSQGDREPVAAAWAVSAYGSLMEGLLELVVESRLGSGHPRCGACPPPMSDLRGKKPEQHQRELAEHLHRVVVSVPMLGELRASAKSQKT